MLMSERVIMMSSADACHRQQGFASEAVGLEAGELHSIMESYPQCASGQHDV